jgi:hypothetical protein
MALEKPYKNCYSRLKSNAKKRKVGFDLSLEEFKKLVSGTQYMQRRGRGKTSLHFDRINNQKGYSIENIQIITNSENAKKGAIEKKYKKKGLPFNAKLMEQQMAMF